MSTSPATPLPGRSPTPQAYDQYVDGLFTYCLSVLYRPDAAAAGVSEVRELALRHVADCPTCRDTAERMTGEPGTGLTAERMTGEPGTGLTAERMTGEPGTGLTALPGPAVPAAPMTPRIGAGPDGVPDGMACAAFLAGVARGRPAAAPQQADPSGPRVRFDQRGFPGHRAPSAGRGVAVRQRVVSAGVLAAVLTAPVLALWGAHRVGGQADPVSSVRVDTELPGAAGGSLRAAATGTTVKGRLAFVGAAAAETLHQGSAGRDTGGRVVNQQLSGAAPAMDALAVTAAEYGCRTVITLVNAGDTAIGWHAVPNVDWLRLSQDDGTLAPGQRITVTVTADDGLTPQRQWAARIAVPPSDAVVALEGGPAIRSGGGPTPSGAPSPRPSGTPSAAPPSGTPSAAPPSAAPPGPPPGSPPVRPSGTQALVPSSNQSGTRSGHPSPPRRSPSPAHRSPSPAHLSPSPPRRAPSPSRRAPSPSRRGSSADSPSPSSSPGR